MANNPDKEVPIKDANTTSEGAAGKNKIEMSTKEAYFASLNEWVQHANMLQAQSMFPWYLFANHPQMFQSVPLLNTNGSIPVSNMQQQQQQQQQQIPPQQPIMGAGLGILGLLDEQAQTELINRTGGYEYVIAPFWKRIIAETIDVLFLLIVKVILIFTLLNVFDIDLGFDFDKEILHKVVDEDDITSLAAILMGFLALSSDLLLLEVLTKVIVCFNEAIWTTANSGATPGKALMNIRILYIEGIVPVAPRQQAQVQANREPLRALLFPAEQPGFIRAFLRAVAKNLIMTLLLPVCFVMIFFKNNRTAYDIMTKTVVVESQANPILRRR